MLISPLICTSLQTCLINRSYLSHNWLCLHSAETILLILVESSKWLVIQSGQKRDRGIKMLEVVKGYFYKKIYEILVGIEIQLSLHRLIRRKRRGKFGCL